MSEEHLGPFVKATLDMIGMMIGVPCETSGEDQAVGLELTQLVGTVGFTGDLSGQICIGLTMQSANKFIGEMMGMEENELDDEIIGDGVGEMANIVAGSAKATFSEKNITFNISLPTITKGTELDVSLSKGERQGCQLVTTELGTLSVTLWLAK